MKYVELAKKEKKTHIGRPDDYRHSKTRHTADNKVAELLGYSSFYKGLKEADTQMGPN